MHSGVQRARAHQRVGCDEVVESVGANALEHVGGEWRLKLEDPSRLAGPEHSVRLDIVERELVEIRCRSSALADAVNCIGDHGERGEPEKIDLEHPHLLERVHVVLRDDDRLVAAAASSLGRLGANGHVFVEWAGRDDDTGSMDAGVAREAFQLHREVEQLAVPLFLLPDFARIFFARGVELAYLRNPLDGFLDGEREVRMVRNQLGEVIGLRRREAERAADILDGRAGFQRPEGYDLADGIASILLPHVLDDLSAALEAEVDVDVGHRDPLRIQESLEEEIELERIDIGNAK